MSNETQVTLYEVVFTGIANRQRKPRRHVVAMDSLDAADMSDAALRIIVEARLAGAGYKRGRWSLNSYKAFESRYTVDSEEIVTYMRPLFDVSTKILAVGQIGE